ncbi:MAG: hypothetical protein IJI25_08665 [Eubacterium sp.]|nr:hypothetical protein [Eubacterium sp.]
MAGENKQTALEIVIDEGSQRVPIKNLAGEEIGVFYFRPTDIGIIQRYNDTVSKFDEIVAPLENIDISAEGTADADDDAAMKALDEAEKRLFEACDYIFGGNMSEAFFGKMHPFSPIGGVFYCETALEKVGSFIASQFDQETKKVSKRLNKYVGRYGKGKK